MSKVGKWSTTAANNNATPPDGWPEGQAPSTVNDCARENMAAIKTALQDMDFFDHDFTPTFINANSFSVPGDQTARIVAGRQLKLFDATTHIRAIGSASFTTVTTISLGAGTALTSSLSSFAVSIINPNNSALPTGFNRISASAIETITLTASGAVVLLSTLSVDGAIVANSTLSVSGAVVLKTTLSVDGATVLGTTLSVSGAVALNSTLTVGGAVVLQGALSVGTTVTIGTTLSVSGAAVVKGALSVGGAAIIAGTIGNHQVFKAWCAFSAGGGTVNLLQNFNVTSITDGGIGNYTVNFTNSLSGTSYASLFGQAENDGVVDMDITRGSAQNKTAALCQLLVIRHDTGAITDASVVSVGFLGTGP